LLLGLLGMAGVQVRATQAEYVSYQRKQAMLLLQDMVDRLQANRLVASCYAITAAGTGSPFAGTKIDGTSATAGTSIIPACTAGSLVAQAVANDDLTKWSNALFGAAETLGTDSVGAISSARGCVVANGSGVYTVSIAWKGIAPTTAPPTALNCGTGLYGDEALRRVVSATLQVATLN
jgi:type IV pilus assembly protein PilV